MFSAKSPSIVLVFVVASSTGALCQTSTRQTTFTAPIYNAPSGQPQTSPRSSLGTPIYNAPSYSAASSPASRPSSTSPLSPSATTSLNDVAQVVKSYGRQQVEDAASRRLGSGYVATSRDRFDSPLASRAHNVNGAVDYAPPRSAPLTPADMKQDAETVSRDLGPNYRAIVEEKIAVPDADGASLVYKDLHTTYQNGVLGNVRVVPGRATGTHVHIQPNYGIKPIVAPTSPWARSTD